MTDQKTIESFLNGEIKHPVLKLSAKDIVFKSDKWWETNHDFIQWVFPSWEKSKFNPDAPLLDKFSKIILTESGETVVKCLFRRFEDFIFKSVFGEGDQNHNYLRMSRAIAFEQYLFHYKVIGSGFKFVDFVDGYFEGFKLPAGTRIFWEKDHFYNGFEKEESKFNNEENECVETKDGRKVWLSRSVATATVFKISFEGASSFLFLKRGEGVTHTDKYCFPCGYLDKGETIKEGAIREVFEETGFLIEDSSDLTFLEVDDNPESFNQNITHRFLLDVKLKNLDEFEHLRRRLLKKENCKEVSGRILVSGNKFLHDCREDPSYLELFAFNHGQILKDLLK